MLKLATVFSGIGAIEHALQRMKIDHEIVFACDSGGIDPFDKMEEEEANSIKEDILNTKDFIERKRKVDDLYSKKKKTNFVKKSYLANYEIDEAHFHNDVVFLNGSQYKGDVDLFVGGSPCQSFSLVGNRNGFEDARGTLFYEYVRLVNEIQPKVFIYENVKGVMSHDEGKTWETMGRCFDELGYTWKHSVLNARDYGVAQNRERLFVVGFRGDLELDNDFEFPLPIELKATMKDYLMDNVSGKYYLNTKGVEFVTKEKNLQKRYTQVDGDIQLCQKANQQFNWHGDFVFVEENKDIEKTIEDLEKYFLSEKVRKYVLSSGTKTFYTKPEIDLDVARPLLTTMHKMHRAGVDNYVTTDGRIRKLTPRECLRLMGFCDSFNIVVSDTQMYQQSGNSIVVDVLIAIIDEVLKSYSQLLGLTQSMNEVAITKL
ncbi:DNA cytosine methyltransferase [Paraclostridium bifermentans]|uniref:Cytosine-specific methyltransferase n=1 Tax=Paraclostridium bifermentans TaxID=1490 RepID=A0AA44IH27_PARBF|nr:DNA cytosine methyltransferase [Paraclostridium bifermentans]NME09457.1 DNA cytosine methyltransferase [Paraclostridium bifermentans]